MRSNHTHTREGKRHAKVSAENKKSKIILFQLQSSTDRERERERGGKYVDACFQVILLSVQSI